MCLLRNIHFACGDFASREVLRCTQAIQTGQQCENLLWTRRRDLLFDCRKHWMEKNESGVWPGTGGDYDKPDDNESGKGSKTDDKDKKKAKSPEPKKAGGATGGGGGQGGVKSYAAIAAMADDGPKQAAEAGEDGKDPTNSSITAPNGTHSSEEPGHQAEKQDV